MTRRAELDRLRHVWSERMVEIQATQLDLFDEIAGRGSR
jgi:hypothetical protein